MTHYTDTPPPQTHKSRDIDDRGTPAEAPKAKVEESRQCLDARANLQRLQGGQAVGIDTDGDGKPTATSPRTSACLASRAQPRRGQGVLPGDPMRQLGLLVLAIVLGVAAWWWFSHEMPRREQERAVAAEAAPAAPSR